MENSSYETQFRALQQRFLQRIEGDLPLLRKLHGECAQRGLHSEELKDLSTRVHQYHGNGRTFGFPDISEAARPLDQLLSELLAGEHDADAHIVPMLGALIASMETAQLGVK